MSTIERCRPAALPPRDRKAGKCSPSPTYPQAPRPTEELIKVALATPEVRQVAPAVARRSTLKLESTLVAQDLDVARRQRLHRVVMRPAQAADLTPARLIWCCR